MSIRQIILRGLVNGLTTPQITEQLKQLHPDSAAASKSAKHIAYYRCQIKQGVIKNLPEPTPKQ